MFALPLALLVLNALASRANPVLESQSQPVPAQLELATSSADPHSAHSPNPASSLTNPILYLCSASNCAGGCTGILLTNVGYSNCYLSTPFTSVQLVDPSNFFLPGTVDIAPANCLNWLSIPQQGPCYNINGPVFTQWGTHHNRGA